MAQVAIAPPDEPSWEGKRSNPCLIFPPSYPSAQRGGTPLLWNDRKSSPAFIFTSKTGLPWEGNWASRRWVFAAAAWTGWEKIACADWGRLGWRLGPDPPRSCGPTSGKRRTVIGDFSGGAVHVGNQQGHVPRAVGGGEKRKTGAPSPVVGSLERCPVCC